MPATEVLERVEIELVTDPKLSAARAGLHYVSDDEPGYLRKRWGRGFTYFGPDGDHVDDEALRARFDALVIPPAWTDVWICPSPDGHILATGRDDKGRKQYIYHPQWERVRQETKFNKMILFGEALGQIRARCEADLRRRGLPRDKVLATVVTLLDRTLIRIGNAEYARRNGSFGLTTLRDRHVNFAGQKCVFSFKGKSGQKHCIELDDRRLARIVRRCRDVPGYELFQYYDDDDRRQTLASNDVNAYLKETTGQDFTAKDFRTWGGTVHAALLLCERGETEDEKEADKNIVSVVKEVAERLGNTPAVCRNYYLHPGLLDAYREGTLCEALSRYMQKEPAPQLGPDEHAVLCFLKERLAG